LSRAANKQEKETAMTLTCGVSADGNRARLSFAGEEVVTLGPVELEQAIWDLVAARAAMTPTRRPVAFPAMRIVLGEGMHIEDGERGRLLAIHHPGLGWLGAPLTSEVEAKVIAGPRASVPVHQAKRRAAARRQSAAGTA
jgi:hypothetical protein